MHPTMRLDAYIRVSKVNGRAGESFISPDVQREQIAAAVTLLGARIICEHVDLDQSGANGERPAWQAALGRIESGETDGIVVAKLDRFARSTLDAVEALRRIDAAGGHFVSAAERFDTTTPFGRFAQTVMFAMAELEHARIRDNWNVATERAVSRGAHTTIPFGYKRGPGKRLVPDATEAEGVRLIFVLRAAGRSWPSIADELTRARIRPRMAAAWSLPAVKRIAYNRAYLGEAFYGVHKNADAHEALVAEPEWQAVQSRRQRGPIIRRKDGGTLLAGLVRCAGCSYVMGGGFSNGWYVYRCNMRNGAGRCVAPTVITQHLVDDYVEAAFLERAAAAAIVAIADDGARAVAHAEVQRAERELVAWRDDVRMREAIGHEHYLAGLSARARDFEQAQEALARARDDETAQRSGIDGALWPTLTVPERRVVLAAGIDTVFVRRGRMAVAERARVLWRGEAHDLPRQGIASTPTPFRW